jgi:uncharacterized protein DUF2784
VSAGTLADLIVALHFAFVVFVLFGGMLVLWRRWVMWVHIPAALWGVFIELTGTICPLTPLENALRRRGGLTGYQGGFIEHYILPALYPRGLTRPIQLAFAVIVIGLNVFIYYRVFRRRIPPSARAAPQPDGSRPDSGTP